MQSKNVFGTRTTEQRVRPDKTREKIFKRTRIKCNVYTRVLRPLKRVFRRNVRHSRELKRPKKTVKLYYSFKVNGVRSVPLRVGTHIFFVGVSELLSENIEKKKIKNYT